MWRLAAVVVAVLLVAGLSDIGNSVTVGAILIALGVGLGVGIVARLLYSRRHS